MLCFGRLVSFLESLFSTILQNCRILILVSNLQNFTRLPQAQQRRLLSSAPVGPFLLKGSALLGLLTGRFCSLRPASSVRPNLATDFSTICFSASQHSSSPLVPVSLCPPFPSFSPHSTRSRLSPKRADSFVSLF